MTTSLRRLPPIMAILTGCILSLFAPSSVHAAAFLQPGMVYWGAAGHRGQDNVYNTALSQQIADLKTIFGSTPDTILYRSLCEGQTASAAEADATVLRAEGILPICIIISRPDFGSFGSEQAAYDWAYNTVGADVQTVLHANLFEIGNEWPLQGSGDRCPLTLRSPDCISAFGDLTNPESWRNSSNYRIVVGVVAGAVAAIRDKRPDAAVIAGATNGWFYIGLPIALGVDLTNYNGRDLSPDYMNLHWYNDATCIPTAFCNRMGEPAAKFGNIYAKYRITGKSIAVTELGSNGGSTADGNNITGLLSSFSRRAQASSSEVSVALGTIYQLYPSGGEGYQLFSSPGNISAAGQVVKDWVAAHGNPSQQ